MPPYWIHCGLNHLFIRRVNDSEVKALGSDTDNKCFIVAHFRAFLQSESFPLPSAALSVIKTATSLEQSRKNSSTNRCFLSVIFPSIYIIRNDF